MVTRSELDTKTNSRVNRRRAVNGFISSFHKFLSIKTYILLKQMNLHIYISRCFYFYTFKKSSNLITFIIHCDCSHSTFIFDSKWLLGLYRKRDCIHYFCSRLQTKSPRAILTFIMYQMFVGKSSLAIATRTMGPCLRKR